MLKITLPDGSEREYEQSTTPAQIAAEIGPRLAKAALAAEVDGHVVGLDYRLPESGEVKLRILT
ncbi:MAG: TGS domain-containing protein, partial [Planctomycetales bacterium]|nr:TGS domain-containing protein [Planctomycetales bacterium]